MPVSPRFGDNQQNHSFKRRVLCDAVRECVRALPHSPLSKAFYLVVPAVSPELLLSISSACVFLQNGMADQLADLVQAVLSGRSDSNRRSQAHPTHNAVPASSSGGR